MSSYFSFVLYLFVFLLISGCMHDPQSTETSRLDEEIEFPNAQLTALQVDERNRYVFVADAQQSAVHFVSARSLDVEDTVDLAGPPFALDISANEDLLAVAIDSPPSISMLDIVSRTVLGTIEFSDAIPTSIAFDGFDRFYVGVVNDDDTRAVRAYDLSGPQPWPELEALSTTDGYIAGRSRDQNRSALYTSDEGAASFNGSTPLIRHWDISQSSPVEINSAELFGSTSNGIGWVFSAPSSHNLLLIYGRGIEGQDGGAFDNGVLPVFDSNSLASLGGPLVKCQPIAAAMTADGERIAVAHAGTVVNAGQTCDESHFRDIHIFDASTYEQLDAIQVSDFVRPNGLVIGPDRTVYALIGQNPTNRLGVFVR